MNFRVTPPNNEGKKFPKVNWEINSSDINFLSGSANINILGIETILRSV